MNMMESVEPEKVKQCRRMALDIYDLFKSQSLDEDQALAGATAIMLWLLCEKSNSRKAFQYLLEAQTALCAAENKNFFRQFNIHLGQNIEAMFKK
jgi:hypothetical protein